MDNFTIGTIPDQAALAALIENDVPLQCAETRREEWRAFFDAMRPDSAYLGGAIGAEVDQMIEIEGYFDDPNEAYA